MQFGVWEWQEIKKYRYFFRDDVFTLGRLQVIGVISVFFICVSILSFCLKTHPDMRVPVIRNVTVR